MRIFLDIGAHVGQSLIEAMQPRWGFDQIHAIEPMPREFHVLDQLFASDERFRLYNYALSDWSGELSMFGSNEALEASIYPDKNDVDPNVRTMVVCQDASDFFGFLPDADLFVNMNCEGAEVPILSSLLHSGEVKRITSLLVDWDIRKVPGHDDDPLGLMSRLNSAGVHWSDGWTGDMPHRERIASWLRATIR